MTSYNIPTSARELELFNNNKNILCSCCSKRPIYVQHWHKFFLQNPDFFVNHPQNQIFINQIFFLKIQTNRANDILGAAASLWQNNIFKKMTLNCLSMTTGHVGEIRPCNKNS